MVLFLPGSLDDLARLSEIWSIGKVSAQSSESLPDLKILAKDFAEDPFEVGCILIDGPLASIRADPQVNARNLPLMV